MDNNEVNESEKNLEVAEQENSVESTEEVVDNVENNEEKSTEETTEKVEESTEKVEETTKAVQSKEDNRAAKNARIQAQKEANEKFEKIRKEAYEQGLKQGKIDTYIGKQNPYTNKVIKDAVDVEEYLTMYDLDSQGKNPIEDYNEMQKEKRRAEVKAQLEKEEKDKQEKFFEDDARNFIDEYGQEKLQELLKDKNFDKFSRGKIGNQSLTEIYSDYQELINTFNQKSVETAKTLIANNSSTPGAINSTESKEIDWTNMSSAEFAKYRQKAIDGELK